MNGMMICFVYKISVFVSIVCVLWVYDSLVLYVVYGSTLMVLGFAHLERGHECSKV